MMLVYSAAPMLVSYEVSNGVYTLSRVGVNEITENDTANDKKGSYATNGYDAYATVTGRSKTDGSIKNGTVQVTVAEDDDGYSDRSGL